MSSKPKQDLPAEEETDEDFMTRITQPRIWTVFKSEFIFQVFVEERFDEVLDMFKNNYIYEESLCNSNTLSSDQDSVDQFLYLIKHWISDTLSSIVIEKSSGKCIGIIVCRFCSIEDNSLEFSRLRLYEGEKWNIIQNFKNYLSQKVDIYKYYKTVAFFRVYAWFILPQYRGQGLGKKLLECVINQQLPEMVHLGCNVISGIFTNKKSQEIANSLGLKTLYEANYPEWANQNNVVLNKKVKAENTTASVMACQINQKQTLQS
ncbi:unnamed protein product [Macrosiphum euphorbiae]|uniref:N-acetyltransferase domain-containing protein n=1 Tax=Macrosiphum euphorbiae TaxID=13131 RepID=A0AAV0WIU8_9HEMI|nr:unnamed protein product [Macrosiphum euphorbiae]